MYKFLLLYLKYIIIFLYSQHYFSNFLYFLLTHVIM
uniref:Uncharacterized protein n=1 Tax=virus sp. ctyMK1 TaxID=2828002 RepID=A0A8S5RF72_9VIRU|nr:MAG TPA: hypothetical protein [virus sp. ctyMK1]